MEWSPQQLEACLAEVPEETLARWYVDLNCWRWPRQCALACPPDFVEAQTSVLDHAVSKALWDYVHAQTTAEARSRAWWLYHLQRSEEEWHAYWALPVCPQCALRHRAGVCCARSVPVRLAHGLLLRGTRAVRAMVRHLLHTAARPGEMS